MIDSGSDDTAHRQLVGMVEAIGDGALRFHVRDDEANIRRLTPCQLIPLARERCTRIALTISPLGLWLPDAQRAEAMDLPDDGLWQGWQWARDDFLQLFVYRNPNLPKLSVITFPREGLWQLDVAGRPMCVWRGAPGDTGWAPTAFVFDVHGFLDDAAEFSAQCMAPTEARREELLAAVATLTPMPPR